MSLSSKTMVVDKIPSNYARYGNGGPIVTRKFFDIIDDCNYGTKAVFVWFADFEVDEDYYLKSGVIRDKYTKMSYDWLKDLAMHNWAIDVEQAHDGHA